MVDPAPVAASPGPVAEVPAAFEREHGLTTADWCRCLPGALQPHPLEWNGDAATARLPEGARLELSWRALPDRRIALMRMPRLAVRFAFTDTSAALRASVMRRFDLYLQRGGG